MYQGEEIVHATASENLSFAASWLFLSIALGSVLTVTFFAAISTSFYCCQKPIKNNVKHTSPSNENNAAQALFFPDVPSTVYPTTQSILQQEDNEVVDSLSPAYRELPSTHFSYVSSFNGTITIDPTSFGNKQSTIWPNSTKGSIHPHTTSMSSEQLSTQTPPNEVPTCQQYPSSTNPDIVNDTSLSIRIASAAYDPQQCLTSSTSGILTEGDSTPQTAANEFEPAMNVPPLNEPDTPSQQLDQPTMNDHRLTESAIHGQRLSSKNEAMFSATEQNAVAWDSSRGASSFGGVNLNASNRTFSPDYYALTFRREGSGLSEVSCSSLRGASAFVSTDQRSTPLEMSPKYEVKSRKCERGASVFGETSDCVRLRLETGPSSTIKALEQQPNMQPEILNNTHESLLQDKDASFVPGLIQGKRLINSADITEIKDTSRKLKCKNQTLDMRQTTSDFEQQKIQDSLKLSCNERPETIATATRASTQKSNKANLEKYENASRNSTGPIRSQKNSESYLYSASCLSKTFSIYDSSKMMPDNNDTVQTPKKQVEFVKPITTQQNTPRDSAAPFTFYQSTPRDSSKPVKSNNAENNTKYDLNTQYQSLRGASQLGDENDAYSDSDAFWDSVSLSFAYESSNDEELVGSH